MKMKKTQSLKFLALSLLVGVAGLFATSWANDRVTLNNSTIFDDGGLKYKVTDFNKSTMQAKVEVSGNALDRDVEEIEIPESFVRTVEGKWNMVQVKGDVTFTVTAIGQDAFMDLPKVKEIVIPGTVETIADDAFDNCGYMATVTFGPNSQITTLGDAIWGVSSVEEIDFSNCHKLDLSTGTPFIPRNGSVNNQLKKVTLPAEIENIGEAFANCPKLETLDLSGTKVVTLEEGALENDAKLTSITFPAVAGKTLLIKDDAMCGSGITEITINTNMTTGSLTASSFAGIALTKVTVNGELQGEASFPANVFTTECNKKSSKNTLATLLFNGDILADNAIATGAVSGLTNLQTLSFSNISKNGIESSAFVNNTKPCTITFNGTLGENAIGSYAFLNSKLAEVTFVQDINTAAIGSYAFYKNTSDKNAVKLTFKGRLTAPYAIGVSAFENTGDTGIGIVTFEKEIIAENAIAKNAFKNAKRIQEITFKEAIKKTNAIDETAFQGAGKNAKLYIEDITEPLAINSSAFDGASILSIVINNLNATQAIAPSQFEGITALNDVTIKCDLTYEDMIGARAFAGTTNVTAITLEGDITMRDAIVASDESESPFGGTGSNKDKVTTLDLKANKIVESGIGTFAFADAGLNVIKLNNGATDLATDAFAANSFLGIPALAKIYYSPAAANVKDHNFVLSAFNPEYADVDIMFYTNQAVKDSYEKTEIDDVTPWRIKFILGIEVELTQGADGKWYGAWIPQDEMYVIDKYQQGTEVFVYSAYYDDKTINAAKVGATDWKDYNKLYMNPLRVQDNGKYVLNAGEALLIRANDNIELIAKQNYETNKDGDVISLTPKYKFGGIQTFAGLNVRQCNDLRFTPWQVYRAAVENDLEDIYGNQLNKYLIIRQTKDWDFQAAKAIPENYLYVLGTADPTLRAKYSVYDEMTDEDFTNPWYNYNDSWYNNFRKILAAYDLLSQENNSKQKIIDDLNLQITELKQQLAEASAEEEIAELNAQISKLEEQLDALSQCHEDDINLMIQLIQTRDAIGAAKAALAAAGNNTAEDVADVEAVANAKKALDDAKKSLADATTEMEKFTMGSIYLKMDAALPYVLAAAQPLKDYKAALATWQEKHQAYLDQVTATQNGEDVTTTTTTQFVPVTVKTNVDAEGNVIPGFVGETYYIKVTEENKEFLIAQGILTEEAEADDDDADDGAGARKMADGESGDVDNAELPGDDVTPAESEPTKPAFIGNLLYDETLELYTFESAVAARIAIENPEIYTAENGTYKPTGIFVYIHELKQIEGDYSFTSYGTKTNYDLLNELGEEDEDGNAEAPAQIQDIFTTASGTKYPAFIGDDGNTYFWSAIRNGYLTTETEEMVASEITLSKKMRVKTLADFMKENSIDEITLPAEESETTDGGVRRFEGSVPIAIVNFDDLNTDIQSDANSDTNSGDDEEEADPYAEYIVWKDLESNSGDEETGSDTGYEAARRAAAGDFNQYSDAVFEKDGKYYQIVEGEGGEDTYALVEIEEVLTDPAEYTDALATGTVDVSEVVTLAGKQYYPIKVLTNVDAEGNEIAGFVGNEYYVAAEDVTSGDELVESAEKIQLLVKQDPNQTYPNPVMWTGIYVDINEIVPVEGDYAFVSHGLKYHSWENVDEVAPFAAGTVAVNKIAATDEDGEEILDEDGEPVMVADIQTVTEEKTEFVPADPESYTYTADDECKMCEAAEAAQEAAAALCEAAKNLISGDDEDPCADLRKQLEDATNALEELLNSGVNFDLTTLWDQLRAAEYKWHTDKASQLTGNESITDEVLAADEQEVERIRGLYNSKFEEWKQYQQAVADAQALVDDLTDALEDCEKASKNDYAKLSEEELTRLMEELETAIVNHLTWEDSNGDEYNPTEDTTVEKEALENYLHAKYGENCTPYDEENATPFIERVAVVPALEEALADATDAAIEAKNEADVAAAETDLDNAIKAHEKVQNDIEAKEDEHYLLETGNASRLISVIWNGESEATGIMESVVAKSGRTADGAIYNLKGMKVNNAQKGIFIQNGKKIVK